MNWADLQVLLAFQREGTLQKASEKLEIDISTVSRRLRSLEVNLGAKVVENVSGRLVLTAYGEEAVQAAAAMETEFNNLQRKEKGKEEKLSGVLRVALLDVFVFFHADLLKTFTEKYPCVSLELISGTTRMHSLNRREADVAIRICKQPDDALVGMRVLHTEYAVYAHRTIADQPQTSFERMPWISWSPSANACMIDTWMAKHVPAEQVRFRVNSPVTQFMMAEAGGGACILPMACAERSNNLVRLGDALAGFDTDIWLLTHRDLRRNAIIQTFFDHCYKALEPLRSPSDKNI